MKRFTTVFFLLLALGHAKVLSAGEVHKIRIDGIINPVSAKFIIEAVERAETDEATALLIELDTPGGLLEATRDIVQSFLAAEVPVIVYVSPAGARAGSAGVFITLAAHVAVMAPGTNIGAAHPVTVGGGGMPGGGGETDTSGQRVMSEKMTNDAVAMIRAIAEERNRNLEWAEKAVRESDAITATAALDVGAIDLIAPSVDSLLTMVHDRIVQTSGGEIAISSEDAPIRLFEMSWQMRLLDKLSDPNIAYILMMLGIYGLIFELSNPGSILPGVIGGICILLAFFAFQALPINAAGILLIIFGIVMLLLEIKVPSYGILTIGGATSLLLGSIMLIDSDVPALKVSLSVIIPSVVMLVLLAMLAVGLAVRAHTRKVTTGSEGLIGLEGEALEDLQPRGKIFANGEYWIAVGEEAISKGDRIIVTGLRNMDLLVRKKLLTD